MAQAGDEQTGGSPEGKALGPDGQQAEPQTAKVANSCLGCMNRSMVSQPGGSNYPLLLSAR